MTLNLNQGVNIDLLRNIQNINLQSNCEKSFQCGGKAG